MGKGVDKKKRNRRKMTPAEHSKRHKTKSIATIFKSTSAEDNGVSPGAPDNQLGNASEDIDEEQPTEHCPSSTMLSSLQNHLSFGFA